jgi:hypothetical protein
MAEGTKSNKATVGISNGFQVAELGNFQFLKLALTKSCGRMLGAIWEAFRTYNNGQF